MNSDSLIQFLQSGFRLSVGATAAMIESLQDSQKREEILSLLMQSEFSQLAAELTKKGEITEQEAREFVDSLWQERNTQTSSDAPGTSATTTTDDPVASPNVQQELQELTAQVAALRAELEKLRTENRQS
jgi:polyhydroxyalkanoate synthesis regulator phasin